MHLSTNEQIELCDIVAEKLSEFMENRGKPMPSSEIFEMIFGGDYCDIFDNLLNEL